MRRAAAMACGVVLGVAASAIHAATGQKGAIPGAVRLDAVKQIRKSVDGWPLIEAPTSPATQRINATLTQLNLQLKDSIRTCDANYRAWADDARQVLRGKNSVSNDWIRTVSVTMTGPEFLSMVATDDYIFCGGAHPDNNTSAMVFDLRTGDAVDWIKLIAPSAGASVVSGSGAKGAVVLAALRTMSVDAAEADCRGAFEDKQAYVLWPDTRQGSLMAMPVNLPHDVQACATELTVTLPQAKQMGFSEALLDAIERANGPQHGAKEP